MNNFCRIASVALSLVVISGCDYVPDWLGGADEEIERLPGERITVLPVATDLQADASLTTIPVALPAVNQNMEWPQHSGYFSSAGSNLGASGNFSETDYASAGDGEAFEHTLIARPVAGGGMVFAMDGEGKISAHDMADVSTKKWVSDGVSEEDIDNANGGGLAYDQGRIYAVSGRGVVVAMDAGSGGVIWRKSGYLPFRSAPRVSGNKLFAITIESELIAFDITSGEPLWSHRGIDETAGLMNAVSPTIDGDTIVVPYESGELYALSAPDGRQLWTNSLAVGKRTLASAIFAGIGGDPVIDGTVVFAASSGGLLAVYDMPYGQPLWQKQVSSVNTPWVSGDYLFVLTADNTLVAFVKYDGRIRWATRLPSFENEEKKLDSIFWRGPVLANGKLAVVSSRGELRLYSAADGTLDSTIDVADDIYTAPIVVGGKMYLINKSAELYSLQ